MIFPTLHNLKSAEVEVEEEEEDREGGGGQITIRKNKSKHEDSQTCLLIHIIQNYLF